jgi:hypothetical protein
MRAILKNMIEAILVIAIISIPFYALKHAKDPFSFIKPLAQVLHR